MRGDIIRELDESVRRQGQFPGRKVERLEKVVRVTGPTSDPLDNLVFWTDLDESNVDREIENQIRHFESVGHNFEWIVYGHDKPADLVCRLRDRGFEKESEEQVVIADWVAAAKLGEEPVGIELRAVKDSRGIEDLMEVSNEVWGDTHDAFLRRWLAVLIGDERDESVVEVAYDGEKPVGAAWAVLRKGRPFALFFGGSVLRDWRHRGIYRAMVASRAAAAVERGHRWCLVDAGAESCPILERAGFRRLTGRVSMRWRCSGGDEERLGV